LFRFCFGILPKRKVFLSQRAIAHLLAALEFISLSEQHTHTLAKHRQGVNIFFFIIFRMVTSKSRANFIFRYVQKKMNELNKVNDISKKNENSVS
jgi:hypothetical protein